MQEQKHETRHKKSKMAVRYITSGILMVVWAAMWLLYLALPDSINGWMFIAFGLILSGVAVAVIGFKVGRIGVQANEDEQHAVERGVEATEKSHDNGVRQPPEPEPDYGEYRVDSSVAVH